MASPAFWRDLQDRFQALSGQAPDMYAMLDDSEWYIAEGPHDPQQRKSVHQQFQALATQAAIAAGVPRRPNMSDAWLDLLQQRSPDFRPAKVRLRSRDGTIKEIDGGTIEHLCSASAEYCVVPETDAFAGRRASGTGKTSTRRPKATNRRRPRRVVSVGTITRRRELVTKYKQAEDINAADLGRILDMDSSAVRGMIREDTTRYSEARLNKFLRALGVSREEWYRK